MKRIYLVGPVILLLVLTLGSMTINRVYVDLPTVQHPKGTATFTLANWPDYDEYGQGIYGFFVGDNSTGSFLWNYGRWSGALFTDRTNQTFEAEAGTYLGLDFRVYLNYTLLDLSSPGDILLGVNYFRMNITVTTPAETVFSQQNLTYDASGVVGTDIWYYSEIIQMSSFVLQASTIYTVAVTYEVFYPEV